MLEKGAELRFLADPRPVELVNWPSTLLQVGLRKGVQLPF